MIAAGSLVVLDEEMGAAVPMDPQEELDNFLLQLPSHSPNASRSVPGGCAICLCPYEEGDVVSWSTEAACKHAFHQGKRAVRDDRMGRPRALDPTAWSFNPALDFVRFFFGIGLNVCFR